uniref:Uncharacterized protein n=1 Tax=Glossina palpalis gambiensis TaxID=67801 RepID=A0A1B0B9P3_9MUSC
MSQIIFAVDVFYFLGFVGGGGVGNGHTGWGVMSATENIFVDSGRGRRDCPLPFEVSKMLLGSGRLNFIGRCGRKGS